MKFIFIVFACFLIVLANADLKGECSIGNIGIHSEVVNSYTIVGEGDQVYSNVNVIIHNYSGKRVNYFAIRTGYLELRDDSSIWNIVHVGNDLILPQGQIIEPGNNFTFGFIIKGHFIPPMYVRRVTCL
ncbi:hypothetical protein CYY_000431 [Polysphondylium violaceum]|uniref:Carbohydrate binding domain-containing protein n=1 Tax=Polysphondylium violaceum TaxID=133409 RepID=A0A8J4UX61_9MYCE|nr:hypothetical protein CYY_000431 [Polysphondylium violaceum]